MAFASDWPVVPIDPLLGMFVAVHRRSPAMPLSQAWHIDGAVSPQQAMLAHTRGAAFACGLEHEVGSLRYSTSVFGVFQVIVHLSGALDDAALCRVHQLYRVHCVAGFVVMYESACESDQV